MVEAGSRHNGDALYQAEIYMSLGASTGGRQRTMCIRGPCRVDKSQAQEDADQLEAASKDSIKAVRDCAARMKKSRISVA